MFYLRKRWKGANKFYKNFATEKLSGYAERFSGQAENFSGLNIIELK
jgi:hypothetical protein